MGGEIGIGVILYEKGKGKFVGDWKNPPHKNSGHQKLHLFCCGYIITLKKQKVKCFCTTKLLNVCEYCTNKVLTDLFTINSKLVICILNFYAELTKTEKILTFLRNFYLLDNLKL